MHFSYDIHDRNITVFIYIYIYKFYIYFVRKYFSLKFLNNFNTFLNWYHREASVVNRLITPKFIADLAYGRIFLVLFLRTTMKTLSVDDAKSSRDSGRPFLVFLSLRRGSRAGASAVNS